LRCALGTEREIAMPKTETTEQPQSVARYFVDGMRLLLPKGKIADKNPDRALTVLGKAFYAQNVDGSRGEKLTFGSKEITFDMARNPVTVIDKDNGILVLPAGERGRKARAGIEQDAVNALLESIRNAPPEPDAVPDAVIAEVLGETAATA